MTSPAQLTPATEAAALSAAGSVAGIDPAGARLLRRHANAAYLLPAADVVARIGLGPDAHRRARRVVAITRWLADAGFPVVEPLELDQPIEVPGGTVTLWRHYPQRDGTPPPSVLGAILRALHGLGPVPIALPEYQPLVSFGRALREADWLDDETAGFLADRRDHLVRAFHGLRFELPRGLIHGDAACSNLLWDGGRAVLADWDDACVGPREQDLALTHQSVRFGVAQQEVDAFAAAYGADVTVWSGYPVLRDIHELHTFTSFLRLAPRDPAAREQLAHRLECLRRDDAATFWTPF